jgi:hypothetical protein
MGKTKQASHTFAEAAASAERYEMKEFAALVKAVDGRDSHVRR